MKSRAAILLCLRDRANVSPAATPRARNTLQRVDAHLCDFEQSNAACPTTGAAKRQGLIQKVTHPCLSDHSAAVGGAIDVERGGCLRHPRGSPGSIPRRCRPPLILANSRAT